MRGKSRRNATSHKVNRRSAERRPGVLARDNEDKASSSREQACSAAGCRGLTAQPRVNVTAVDSDSPQLALIDHHSGRDRHAPIRSGWQYAHEPVPGVVDHADARPELVA